MSDIQDPLISEHFNRELNILKLFSILWKEKKIILASVMCFAVVGVIYAVMQKNIYKAQVVLAPADESSGGGLSAMANQFSGLASLAGVNLGKGTADKTTLALEVLKSRIFINTFINNRAIAAELLAAEKWDGKELIIDDKLYDLKNEKWNDNFLRKGDTEPTHWDLYNAFMEVLSINQDKTTGLVTLSVEHISPVAAKNWLNWLVLDLNQHIRESDVHEAQTSVDFLKKQINETLIADMQKMFYQLIEKQYQTIMLANVREQYMFKVIDPAVIPQERVKPKRSLIVILFSFFGGVLGVIVVVLRNSIFKRQ